MIRVVYVAGPYRAATPEAVAANVARASLAARDLLAAGYAPICPHTMLHGWQEDTRFQDADFLLLGLDLLRRSDAVFVLEGWEHSEGTQAEMREAERIGLPMVWAVDALDAACRRSTRPRAPEAASGPPVGMECYPCE